MAALIAEQFKELSSAEMMAANKLLASIMEKKILSDLKLLEKLNAKKAEADADAPKRTLSAPLQKLNAWRQFVLSYHLTNGWDAYKVVEKLGGAYHKVSYSKSVLFNSVDEKGEEVLGEDGKPVPCYIFENSVTEKDRNGKQMTLGHVMQLCEVYHPTKGGHGTREDLWEEFEAQYQAPAAPAVKAKATKPKAEMSTVELTLAEKEALKEQKKKEALEKAKATRAANKAKKQAEEAAAAIAAGKEPPAPVVPKAKPALRSISGTAVSKTGAPVVPVAPVAPVAAVAPVRPKPVLKKKATWDIPADGELHPWTHKGVDYFVNSDREIWKQTDDDDTEWVGVYNLSTDSIDVIPDPYEDA